MSARDRPTLATVTCLHYPGERLDSVLPSLDALRGEVAQVIIVLDGVTDEESHTVERWAASRADVVLVVHAAPQGVAQARNAALHAVTAEYIWFIDDDDEWHPRAPERIRAALHARPDVLMFGARYRYGADGDERRADGLTRVAGFSSPAARALLLRGQIHGFLWSKVFARSVLGESPFPPLSSQSDVVGVARAFATATTFRAIPEVLYTYVRRPGSITRISTIRLRNLREAQSLVLAHIPDEALGQYFAAWFYCIGVVRTVARQRVGLAAAREELQLVRRRAREIVLRDVRRENWRTAAWILLLRVSPALCVGLARAAYVALDVARALRSLSRGA